MAVDNAAQWTIRTDGSANNGGGFVSGASGTDYSDQASAQESYTTLACTTGGSTLTCSGGDTFDANIVGNIIKITGGTNFTTGWYEVTARASSTSVTLDRDPTNGSNGSSGTGNMGGALDIDRLQEDTFITTVSDWSTAAMIIWIKSGSYTMTSSGIGSVGNSFQYPIELRGYKTTRGDTPDGSDRPEITMGSAFYLRDYVNAFNLIFLCSESSGFRVVGGTTRAMNCRFVQDGGGDCVRVGNDSIFVQCEFEGSGTRANLGGNADPARFVDCYFEFVTTAVYSGGAMNCVFNNCSTGVVLDDRHDAINCTFHSCTLGVDISSAQGDWSVFNNIFNDCTTGIDATAAELPNIMEPNVFYNCTNNYASGDDAFLRFGSATEATYLKNGTSDPTFADEANDDFTPDSVAEDTGTRLPKGG